MEKIGAQKIWAYYDHVSRARPASNQKVRAAEGNPVKTYFDLAMRVAELQFLNRDHVLLFRGQRSDYRSSKGNTMLKASMFRLSGKRLPTGKHLQVRFERLKIAESELVTHYRTAGFRGSDRVARHRAIRWAILQHYDVCRTPLLDVSQSLRIAASFATEGLTSGSAYLFVLAVPNVSGAVTASSESGLQILRLSSACPPEAVRPHVQEGYLLGEYPEVADFTQNTKYSYYEMDFGRRLVAKFKLNVESFWHSSNFVPAPIGALYPHERRDPLLQIAEQIKDKIGPEVET